MLFALLADCAGNGVDTRGVMLFRSLLTCRQLITTDARASYPTAALAQHAYMVMDYTERQGLNGLFLLNFTELYSAAQLAL
jgi:hypothetical protein